MPYHHVSANGSSFDITLYLEVSVDTNEGFSMPDPFQQLMGELAIVWGPIADAMNFRLIVVPSEAQPDWPPQPGTALFADATPADRILFYNDVLGPPSNVKFFKFKVGVKDSSRPESQCGKISEANYLTGKGYIYSSVLHGSTPHQLHDISHELGHVFGLTDRYYDAVAWYGDQAIDRTPKQVRHGNWYNSLNIDQRFAIPGTAGSADGEQGKAENLPRFAERLSLLMDKSAVPLDSPYDPYDNLMSSSNATITKYQLGLIGIKNGQIVPPNVENKLRTNWVAILGDRSGTINSYKSYPAWEVGGGLRYHPPTAPNTTLPYPCWNGTTRGLGLDNKIFRPDLIATAMGERQSLDPDMAGSKYLHGSRSNTPSLKDKMCFCTRLLTDLK